MRRYKLFWRGVLSMTAALVIVWIANLVGGWPYVPLLIAERMIELTPGEWAVPLLNTLGILAKPFAATGGVAVLTCAGGIGALAGLVLKRVPAALAGGAVIGGGLWLLGLVPTPAALAPVPLYVAVLLLWREPRAEDVRLEADGRLSRRAVLALTFRGVLSVAILGTVGAIPMVWRALRENAGRRLLAFTPPVPRRTEFENLPGLAPEVTSVEDFYVMSKTAQSPQIDAETWALPVEGAVAHPFALSWNEMLAWPSAEEYATLECVSNPVGGALLSNGYWTGIRLAELLEHAGVQPGAQSVAFHARDTFSDSIPLEFARLPETLIVYALNGIALPISHGAPARLYTPNRYGFKNVKWIDRIEVRMEPYRGRWQELGWSSEAVVKTMARIDTLQRRGEDWLAAGVAFAGARGISRVEVRVDEGEWQDAMLHQPPLGALTWVQWLANLGTGAGRQLAVRAWDGRGELQSEARTGIFPEGAGGWHTVEWK